MGQEMTVYNTPFCYKNTYDRGAGQLPSSCDAGKEFVGADLLFSQAGLCYDQCRSGYSKSPVPNAIPICAADCPSGYSDTGLTCHYTGSTSYALTYWENCASRGLFGECYGGLKSAVAAEMATQMRLAFVGMITCRRISQAANGILLSLHTCGLELLCPNAAAIKSWTLAFVTQLHEAALSAQSLLVRQSAHQAFSSAE